MESTKITSSMDELPDDLRKKLQDKIDADVKAFLKSCDKNRHDRVTQFCEPDFGDATATSSTDHGKAKFGDEVQSALNEGRLSLAEMQIDKAHFPAHMDIIEAGAPAILIRPEQADTTKGKNVIIGEPYVAPNEKNSGRKVVLEMDEDGKDKLVITAGSRGHLNMQQRFETVAAQQRPARPASHVGQANPTRLGPEGGQAGYPARPASEGGQVDFHGSGPGPSSVHALRTFVPKRPEIGTWKTNIEKNKGKFVKKLCTFDKLMAKYKAQKADFENRPLKKRESTPPKCEDEKNKRLVVSQVTAPVQQVVAPRVSRWGPPIVPQWGPHGVWVPYPPPMPMNVQQSGGELVGISSKPSVFSRLSIGQSSSSGVNQVMKKSSAQQVWLPKKTEASVVNCGGLTTPYIYGNYEYPRHN